jgi:hypothetical protein
MKMPSLELSPLFWATESYWLGPLYCIARFRDEQNPQEILERRISIQYAQLLKHQGRLVSGWHAGHKFGGCDLCDELAVENERRQ